MWILAHFTLLHSRLLQLVYAHVLHQNQHPMDISDQPLELFKALHPFFVLLVDGFEKNQSKGMHALNVWKTYDLLTFLTAASRKQFRTCRSLGHAENPEQKY